MNAMTIRRLRTLPGVALCAVIAFATARAGPPELFVATRDWDPRRSHDLESLRAPPAGATGSALPVALQRLKLNYVPTRGFYESHLAPRMSYGLRDEIAPAAEGSAIPTSNVWARDLDSARRVQRHSIRTIGGAVKGYLIERLGIASWSLPLAGGNVRGVAAPGRDAGAMRLRLGFSHLAPRADLLIPVSVGRVVVSADARGRVGTTFEPKTSRLRLAADVDVPEHAAAVRLSVRF
jgi:hypothetical protein